MTDANHALEMKYAFLSNRVLRVLVAVRSGGLAPEYAPQTCERAAKWLLEMRRGAAVFDRTSQGQLGYSAESIPAVTRALGVIAQLSLASHMAGVRQVLAMLEKDLEALSRGEALEATSLENLYQFFGALNRDLTEEVAQASLGSALEMHVNA